MTRFYDSRDHLKFEIDREEREWNPPIPHVAQRRLGDSRNAASHGSVRDGQRALDDARRLYDEGRRGSGPRP